MEIAKEKYEAIMQKYGQLTGTGLEKKVTEAFTEAVKKSVGESQRLADTVVNRIAPRRAINQVTLEVEESPADYEAAKEALGGLAKSVGPVVDHWRPFVELACEALEVDVSKMLPRSMVPDPKALEKALGDAAAERKSLETVNGDLDEENVELKKQVESAVKNMATALEMQAKAEADLADARKAGAELLAENEALKAQLEALKKAAAEENAGKKPSGRR